MPVGLAGIMRCLYEVLGVSRDSDDGTIKTAYRRGALEWHPDKNQHRLEEADARFRELQNAYEVLSDKHERSWYDSHRDAILRSGSSHQAGGDSVPAKKDQEDLFSFFSSACFSGYSDGPKGFYTVYRGVFDNLAREEEEDFDAAASKGRDLPAFPSFGNSDASAKQVSEFYSFWQHFVSDQSFDWADEYNLAAAPNRMVRRRMEEENRRARKHARRVFNDKVRELASFVRKRDKRVSFFQAQQAQRKLEAEEREQQRREAERQRRIEEAQQYAKEERLAQEAAGLDEHAEASDSELEELPDVLYCVACDKTFKSDGAMRNHERSKKHLEKAEALRLELEEEAAGNSAVDDDQQPVHAPEDEQPAELTSHSDQEVSAGRSAGSNSRTHAQANGYARSQDTDDASTESESGSRSESASASGVEQHTAAGSEEEVTEDDMLQRMLHSHTAAAHQRKPARHKARSSSSRPPDAEQLAEQLQAGLGADNTDAQQVPAASSVTAAPGKDDRAAAGTANTEIDSETPLVMEASSSVAAEAAPAPAPALSNKQRQKLNRMSKQVGGLKNQMNDRTVCMLCNVSFESRNALFSHLAGCRGQVGKGRAKR